MLRHALIAACAAMAVSAPAIAQAAASSAVATPSEERPIPAHRDAAWTDILNRYVAESADGVNRFDYGGLKASEDDRAALDAYVASFAALDFDALSDDEQFAAWANLYNALTIQHIIGRYPVKSIRSGYIIGPWKEVKVTADGREVSLDDIEHDILREEWDEPRVHYAVNCASYGCPNLMNRAWRAETLDEDLDAGARAYVNHPRGVSIRRNGTLEVSTIYKWFREDFGGSKDGVVEHVLQYADDDLAAQIRANPKITKHSYDWALNDVDT
ncbi:MAG: DUF547 domain-containing protein [Pseudomonadota bacterium]